MRAEYDLNLYQRVAIDFLRDHPWSALWLDMGLGKTISVLTLLVELLMTGEIKKVLIVAPLKVALRTWPNEIAGWEHTAGLEYTVIRPTGQEIEVQAAGLIARDAARRLGLSAARASGFAERAMTAAEEKVRLQLMREPTPVHIINRERLPWLVRRWGSRWPYDTLIWDEASGLRDHTSERFRMMSAIRKYLRRLHEMTATPRPESYLDLFPQIWLLDKGKRLGDNITRYRDKYFTENRHAHKYFIKDGAADEIIGKVADIVLDMKAKDYLDLAEPVMIDRVVTLSPRLMEQYEELEATSVLELPEGVIEAETAGAMFQKLKQFASGAIYDAEKRVHALHDEKLDDLEEIIEETLGEPMLIAYHYRPSLARLKKRFPDAVVLSPDGREEAAWNKGKIKKLLLHPASAGHGLNLQYGGRLLTFFDVPDSYENYDQTIHRLARQGQEGIVEVFHISTAGTEDANSVPRLRRKQSDQDYMFTRLRQLRAIVAKHKRLSHD